MTGTCCVPDYPLYLLATVSASICSSSSSASSSILSSLPDFLSPSLVPVGQLGRPRALWLRRTLRPRPFLLWPREEVWMAGEAGLVDGQEGDRGEGLARAARLWVNRDGEILAADDCITVFSTRTE